MKRVIVIITLASSFLLAQENQAEQKTQDITRYVHYTSKPYKTITGMYYLRRHLIIKEECTKNNSVNCKNQYQFEDEDGDGSYDNVKVRLGKNYSTSRIVGKDLEDKINSEIIATVDVATRQMITMLDNYVAGKLNLTVTAKTIRYQSTEYSFSDPNGPDFIVGMERKGDNKAGDTVKFIALGNSDNQTSYNLEVWGLNKRMLQIVGTENKISPQVAEKVKPIGGQVLEKLRMDHGSNVGYFPNVSSFSKK